MLAPSNCSHCSVSGENGRRVETEAIPAAAPARVVSNIANLVPTDAIPAMRQGHYRPTPVIKSRLYRRCGCIAEVKAPVRHQWPVAAYFGPVSASGRHETHYTYDGCHGRQSNSFHAGSPACGTRRA